MSKTPNAAKVQQKKMTYANMYAIFLHFSSHPLIHSSAHPLSLRAFAAEIEVATEREGHQEQGKKGVSEK